MTANRSGRGVDDELQQLVRSLDDLDAELAAGDLDPVDYETLRRDYTVRVADAVRNTDESVGPNTVDEVPTTDPSASEADAGFNRWLVLAALAFFAVGAGWLLARSAGERGIGEALTGSIDQSARQRVAECQNTGMNDGDLLGAIQCFDEVLTTDPDNPEALTYRAWFLVLAASSGVVDAEAGGVVDGDGDDVGGDAGGAVSAGGTAQEVELLEAARLYLDQAIEVDPAYADARAFRAVVADRLGNSNEVCRQIEALLETDPPPFFIEQTQPVAERNGCGSS